MRDPRFQHLCLPSSSHIVKYLSITITFYSSQHWPTESESHLDSHSKSHLDSHSKSLLDSHSKSLLGSYSAAYKSSPNSSSHFLPSLLGNSLF